MTEERRTIVVSGCLAANDGSAFVDVVRRAGEAVTARCRPTTRTSDGGVRAAARRNETCR